MSNTKYTRMLLALVRNVDMLDDNGDMLDDDGKRALALRMLAQGYDARTLCEHVEGMHEGCRDGGLHDMCDSCNMPNVRTHDTSCDNERDYGR